MFCPFNKEYYNYMSKMKKLSLSFLQIYFLRYKILLEILSISYSFGQDIN